MSALDLIANATLVRQSYGIATAQNGFGGARGIWLECTSCPDSQVIAGSNSDEWAAVPTPDAAQVFLRHGWAGNGDNLTQAKCPKCSVEAGK